MDSASIMRGLTEAYVYKINKIEPIAKTKTEVDNKEKSKGQDIIEAVLSGRDYEIKNGKVYISKANYRNVHKAYNGKDKKTGEPTMMAMGPKGTTLFPVVFTEDVEEPIEEASAATGISNTVDNLVKQIKKSFKNYFQPT